jgi:hypothetical protein
VDLMALLSELIRMTQEPRGSIDRKLRGLINKWVDDLTAWITQYV